MYIKTGNLISRSVITNLLKAVPEEDLEGLVSICIRTVPRKKTKKEYNRWGGLHGSYDNNRVWLYLYGITRTCEKEFRYPNSSILHMFIDKLAEVLYHELGHHDHSKTDGYESLREKYGLLWKERRGLERKIRRKHDGIPVNYGGEIVERYNELYYKMSEINSVFERHAIGYGIKTTQKSKDMGLLTIPHVTDMRFFSIFRTKIVDRTLEYFKEEGRANRRILCVLDHLRKYKLGSDARYNLREVYNRIFPTKTHDVDRNTLRRFRRFVLKKVDPTWYVSETGMKYPYFSQNHMDSICDHEYLLSLPRDWCKFVDLREWFK